MAEYLGVKFNPEKNDDNDICIYVKPALEGIGEGSYIDVVEDLRIIDNLLKYPKLKIIVLSQAGHDYLKNCQYKNDIVIIPQQHCNFERFVRDRKEITTVGVIGSKDTFDYSVLEFRKRMEAIGLKFITNYSFGSRQEVVNFYKQIDIQVSWNVDRRRRICRQKLFRDSLRLKNAASFGIPTVAFPEVNYKEFEGNYIPVKDIDSMIEEIKKLKDKEYYKQWSDKIIIEAENFHISKIAEKYKQL